MSMVHKSSTNKVTVFANLLNFYGEEKKNDITFKQLNSSIIEVYYKGKTIVHSFYEPIVCIDSEGIFVLDYIEKKSAKKDLVKYALKNEFEKKEIKLINQENLFNQIFK